LRRTDSVIDHLRTALAQSGFAHTQAEMRLLEDRGLAYWRIRLCGHGVLARIPKKSQMGLSAADNLAYQAACYARMAVSGHCPRLIDVVPPSESLPEGALIIEEISGRLPRLPADLSALVLAFARIHGLPVPAPSERPPLWGDADPFAELAKEIREQAAFITRAEIGADSLLLLQQDLRRLEKDVNRTERPPIRLISFDAHPENFLIREDGSAVLVELEKARYSYPPLDLADATLYTSTTWDAATRAELRVDQTAGAYRDWAIALGQDAHAYRDWLIPLRRAMWLRSITWCAKWRVLSRQNPPNGNLGAEWSPGWRAASRVAHVRDRVDTYLAPNIIARVRKELVVLDKLLT